LQILVEEVFIIFFFFLLNDLCNEYCVITFFLVVNDFGTDQPCDYSQFFNFSLDNVSQWALSIASIKHPLCVQDKLSTTVSAMIAVDITTFVLLVATLIGIANFIAIIHFFVALLSALLAISLELFWRPFVPYLACFPYMTSSLPSSLGYFQSLSHLVYQHTIFTFSRSSDFSWYWNASIFEI
jgi:hypothetical protein